MLTMLRVLTVILILGLLLFLLLPANGPQSMLYKDLKDSLSSTIHLHDHSRARPIMPAFHVPMEDIAFLGPRKDSRTIANASNIIERCKGQGQQGWRDTSHCVQHLRLNEDEYLSVDTNAAPCDSKHALRYHTYWRGPLTWRVSFMLKSFLFTQNLECSEMHIWLDADHDSEALEKTLQSPILRPFLPLLDAGLIHLRAWTYPSALHIPREHQEDDLPADDLLQLRQHQIPRGPVAVSDSVRFIVLHQEGGLYVDMDTIFLKDMRPLLIAPDLSFAERWGAHPGAGEYNTAYLRLQANSSLSSRILQGAARMGLNFHPRVIGRLLAKTADQENDLVMFETGVFDPLWSFFDHDNIGRCTVPCLGNFAQFYYRRSIPGEWSELEPRDALFNAQGGGSIDGTATNRTLSNFYRGAYIYHIHNQWHKQVVPGSWAWTADQSYNQFFRGERTNPYGERWPGKIDFSAEEANYKP